MTSEIRNVRFVAVQEHPRDDESEPQLIGYASLISGLFVLDGFGVHAWPDGRHSISFPTRKSPGGKVHRTVRATDKRARFEIERRILLALERQGALR